MSFGYLHSPYDQYDVVDDKQAQQDYVPHATGLQFHIPHYLFDAPPTLAPGGGAEAFHPAQAQAATWFTNSGFTNNNAVQNAYSSLADAFPSHSFLASEQLQIPTLNASPPPAPYGLPLYSQSGFDAVSLLARVTSRPNPTVQLGPIDFTTSFVVVDCRRYDDPIVYCSPNFCTLTGYAEREVQGRNCRFLQGPPPTGPLSLEKGDQRAHTSLGAVRALAKAVVGRKEAQVSVVNYRKDGEAFVNLVSIVPLVDEDGSDGGVKGDVVWFIGFQVDLTKQSEGIAKRVREGRYFAGAVSVQNKPPTTDKKNLKEQEAANKERRITSALPAPPRMSLDLSRLLQRPAFLTSCGVPALPTAAPVPNAGIQPDPSSHILHSLLLGALPDFVHVLSLKGAFLYVSPAVTRVLGWAPSDLVGHALADVCFERDVVSVGRALKEASLPIDGSGSTSAPSSSSSSSSKDHSTTTTTTTSAASATLLSPETVRVVDLLFRARTKQGGWVWVECRGRLHVEPGKGRKAIVLIGRARGMARVEAEESVSEPMTMTSMSTTSQMQMQMHTPPVPVPVSSSSFYPSPTGSASGLEFALQPQSAVKSRPRRTTRSLDTASSSQTQCQTQTPQQQQLSATEPTAFHGLVDPYGLLLSVGSAAGCRRVLGMGSGADWDPSTLRGTKLAALVVVPDDDHGRDHTRTSSNNTNPVDALFESWRAFPKPREVCVKMRCPGSASGLGQVAVPVQVIVRIVGPTSPQQERERDQERELPPFVMPAPLMYSVRLASVPSPSPHALSNSASTSTFTKLDPANGESESWQYEISQLKFANERLVEEIRALERAAAVGGGNGTERERVVYMNPASTSTFDSNSTSNSDPQQQQQQQQWGYSASAPLMYQLPMKRPWDRRE